MPEIPDEEKIEQRPLTQAEREELRAEHRSWIRYIFLSALDGIALGALVAVVLIQFDVNGIGQLLANSAHPWGFALMLIVGFAHTFGMVVSGLAIWWRAVGKQD